LGSPEGHPDIPLSYMLSYYSGRNHC